MLTLEEEVTVGEAELQQGGDLWDGHVGSLWKCGVLLQSLFDYLYGWLYWYRDEQSLYIKGGDDLPWLQLFALKLLYKVLRVFEVMGELTYKRFDDVG